MNWIVYIAKSRTNRYYVGITTDVEMRLIKHNSGKGSRFGKQQGPLEIVYASRGLFSKSEARIREIQLKKWSRTKKEKLISGEWQ